MKEKFFQGTPNLFTRRLLLRRLVREDASAIFAYASDREVNRFMTWSRYKSLDEAHNFIRIIQSRYERDQAGEWGIVLRETGCLVGCIGFAKTDKIKRSSEVGYVLNPRYWGQGIMAEAMQRIMEFAFCEIKLNRLEGRHLLANEKSGRVMEKAGMHMEGVFRGKICSNGSYWDVRQYGILRADWQKKNSKKGNLIISRS